MDNEFDDAPESVNGDNEDKQSVSSDLIRGHINTIILRSLYDGDKYGYEIISGIERKSRGQYSLKQPSLYSALKRLEKEGFITSYWGGSVSGGRRKYFSLTDAGRRISEQNQSEWEYSRTVIDSLISDKTFDFNNPAPVSVDMRVLRDSTTRARVHDYDDETSSEERVRLVSELAEKQAELDRRQAELEAEAARLSQERSTFSQLMDAHDSLDEERTVFAESATQLEQAREALDAETARFQAEKKRFEEEMDARNDALLRERAWREHEIAERERRLAEEKKSLAENRSRIGDEEFRALDERLRENEEALSAQRSHYEEQIRLRDSWLEEEQQRHSEELELREKQIIEEQETLFRQREQELLHQNYLGLINTPPTGDAENEYRYFTAPVGDEPLEETPPVITEQDVLEYRGVVRRIYANAINSETTQDIRSESATSLDGMDFHDLEERAAQDGIRIYTAGGKSKTQIEEISQNVIHKGKALFVSAIALFVFCVVLGAILLGVRSSVSIPVYYPYLIWGIGLVVLLVCGLAYANKFGERSLRRSTPAIVHAIVLFLLLVIIALIIALWVRIDFTDIGAIATFIIVPDVFFLGVIIFGLAYYLQVRPNRY